METPSGLIDKPMIMEDNDYQVEITLSSGDEVDLKSLPLQVARPEGDNVMSTPSQSQFIDQVQMTPGGLREDKYFGSEQNKIGKTEEMKQESDLIM